MSQTIGGFAKPTWVRLERLGWTALLIAWLVQGYVGVFRRDNDFRWHIDRGSAFRAGQPNDDGRQWYPLARYAWDAILALPPYRLARGISLLAATAALVGAVTLWRRMLLAWRPIAPESARRAILGALLLCLPALRRDLDDCGLHLVFLFLASAAVYGVFRGHGIRAGVWGALAVCYKPTALLIWPFFVWKRQWSAALALPIACAALNLAPAVYLGWSETLRFHGATAAIYRRAAANNDFLVNGVEEPRHENQALPFALARFLQSVPPSHVLFLDHPLFVPIGGLSPAAAAAVIRSLLMLLAVWFAWRTRRGERSTFAAESAGVLVLVALVSPLCWKQHLVLLLPALMVFAWNAARCETKWIDRAFALGFIATGFLSKDLLGRELAIVAASYKVDAILSLALLWRVVGVAAPSGGVKRTPLRLDRSPVARYQRPRVPLIDGVRLGAGRQRDDSFLRDRAPSCRGRLRAHRHGRARAANLARREPNDEPRPVAADA